VVLYSWYGKLFIVSYISAFTLQYWLCSQIRVITNQSVETDCCPCGGTLPVAGVFVNLLRSPEIYSQPGGIESLAP
jgi:hypothetical protein